MAETAADVWTVPVGLDSEFEVQVCDSEGTPIAHSGVEVLLCQAWRGDDAAPIAGVLSAAWSSPEDGLFVASVSGSTTAGMTPGYLIRRISIVSGGKARAAVEGWLELTDSPGSAVAPRCYCSLQDMLDVGGDWIVKLMMDSGRTDFLAERARATSQLDKVILARWRPNVQDFTNYTGDWTDSVDGPPKRVAADLAAGGLVVDAEIRAAVASLAVAYACERSLTWEADDPMARRAAAYHRRWRSALPGLYCGIDADADGTVEYWVDLSVTSLRPRCI